MQAVKQKMTMQKWTTPPPHPPCGLFVMQYLLGVGGSESGVGECAAGGFDELRLMLLSMGPLLEMDSNMQHDDDDDDSQIQTRHWLPDSGCEPI